MHNERCTSGSEGGPEKPIGRKAERALRFDPTCVLFATRTAPFRRCRLARRRRAKHEPCRESAAPKGAAQEPRPGVDAAHEQIGASAIAGYD